ncbi:MAG: cell division protein ZapA [Pseudomonadota bacterium]
MPEVEINIGGRAFRVACQAGEEHFLQSAAKLLNNEANVLSEQIGRMPETRMLLMAGLMLADKTAGLEEELRSLESQMRKLNGENETLKSTPAEKVEVAVIPDAVIDSLAEIAARAEAVAERLEPS